MPIDSPLQNEREKCADRENGFYYTRRSGDSWIIAEFNDNGWRVPWSGWYQNDSDFELIGKDRLPDCPED